MLPGQTHDISIRFAPTSEGKQYATLNLPNNVEGKEQLKVNLEGQGVTPDEGLLVSIPDRKGRPGTKVVISVEVGDTTGLGITDAGLTLTFDEAVLTDPIPTTLGTIAEEWGEPVYNNQKVGELKVGMAETTPLSGSGSLLDIVFDVVETAVPGDTTDLTLADVEFNAGAIDVRLKDGKLTVVNAIYGDVDGDDRVTPHDASLVLQYRVELIDLTEEQVERADVSCNGEVTAYDAYLILRYYVGLIDRFPCEEETLPAYDTQAVASTLELSVPDVEGYAGDDILVPISIGDTTGLDIISVDIDLDYDPDVLEFMEASNLGTIASSWEKEQNSQNGKVLISMYRMTSPLSGAGVLVYVKFRALNAPAQTIPLTLSYVLLNNSEGAEVSATAQNGSFTLLPGQKAVDLGIGWNFISLPLEPLNKQTAEVLSDISQDVRSVWTFDPELGWFWYKPDMPQDSTLSEMRSNVGYWVDMENQNQLVIQGDPPGAVIQLKAGKNLVGFSEQDPKGIAECISSISQYCIGVWGYERNLGWIWYRPPTAVPQLPVQGDLDSMMSGKGYCIEVTQGCPWSP